MTGRTSDKQHRLGLLITLFCAVTYGAWPAGARGFYNDAGNVIFLTLIAQFARLVPLLFVCWKQNLKLFRTPETRRDAFIGGSLQAASTSLIIGSIALLPGPLTIVIMFTHTLMLLFYSAWRGEIKLDHITVLTTVIALAGLTFVLDLWHTPSGSNLLGMMMAFIAAVMIASRLYVYGHMTQKIHPAIVGAENFLVANLLMPLLLLFGMPHAPVTWHGYAWCLLACIALACGTLGQFYAIAILGSFRYSLLLKLEPLFTVIFSAALVGELLKTSQNFGIVLVVGSLAFYQIIDHRRRKQFERIPDTAND